MLPPTRCCYNPWFTRCHNLLIQQFLENYKAQERRTPLPHPRYPTKSRKWFGNTAPSTHAFQGWKLPLSQATTASRKSVAQMKLNFSNSCFVTAVKWQNCPCHNVPNLRILWPVSLDTNILPSILKIKKIQPVSFLPSFPLLSQWTRTHLQR